VTSSVHIAPWSAEDHALLTALNGDAAQMAHVGGAETGEKIAERQGRYERDPRQFAILVDGERAGWVGFWARGWRGAEVYEIGWSVLPAFQGRGAAKAATLLALDAARAAGGPRAVHAFPGTDNAASNAVCRSAGFALVEADLTFEYPPGTKMVVNDWRAAL
jgi:RimJ/RimL family protein N-acetyltransferase